MGTSLPPLLQGPCQSISAEIIKKNTDSSPASSYNPNDMSSAAFRLICGSLVVFGLSGVLDAQQGGPSPQLTRDDYARAEKFMTYDTAPLVLHSGVRATWVSDDKFWYRTTTDKGPEAFLVDASSKTRSTCDLPECKAPAHDATGGGRGARNDTPSPDGKLTAFTRDWNLWVREVNGSGGSGGKETQLTRDGVKDYGYATDNAGWTRSDRPIVVWSPDSKKIATFQQDQRNVGEMYLVDTRVGHPVLQAWKYPLPGDQIRDDDRAARHRGLDWQDDAAADVA